MSKPIKFSDDGGRTLRVTLALGLASLVLTSQLYVALPVMQNLAGRWHVDVGITAWLTAAFGLAYAAGFVLIAPFALRSGYRRAAMTGLALLAVTTAALAVAPTFESAIAIRVLQGLSASPFIPAALSYVTTRLHAHRRTVAVAGLIAMSFSAGIVAQLLTPSLVDLAGWPTAIVVEAGMLAAAFAAVAAMVPRDEGTASAPAGDPIRTFVDVMRQRQLRPLLLATPALLGSFVLIYTGLQLTGPFGLRGSPEAFMALRATALPAIALSPLISFLLRSLPPRARARTALLVASAGLGAASAPVGFLGLACALFVAVAGIAVAAPALVGAIAERTSAHGPANAVYSFTLFAGAALGGPLASVLAPGGAPLVAVIGAVVLATASMAAGGRPDEELAALARTEAQRREAGAPVR